MKKVLSVIDSISRWSGFIARWGCLALVLALTFEVVSRYAFDRPTIWAHEMSMMLGVFIVTIGWAFVHLNHGHVRVDVFYTRLSPRGKATLDIACFFVFFLPLLLVLIYAAAQTAWDAYVFKEVLMASFWYPPAQPLRIIVLIGACLVFLQFTASFVRRVHYLAKGASQ